MNKLKKLRKYFKNHNLDGYIVPKNDEFFGEYVDERNDRLYYISSFSGSAGYALILKKKSYLFVAIKIKQAKPLRMTPPVAY